MIVASTAVIIHLGAKPVFVDVKSDQNIDENEIEKKITKKTKAIIMVHIYGLTVDVSKIVKISKKYNLKIIEDAAEVVGQNYKSKPCGSFGDISTFSFYANKCITTGEGGMIVTPSEDL